MIKFIVDSSAELDSEFCKKNNIILMPNTITFGDDEYVAGETLSNQEFYKKLREDKILPKTALINQFRFSEVFKEAQKNKDEIIVLAISSGLSTTHNMAVLAQKEVGYDKIYVIDHKTVTVAQTALVLEGLKLRDAGKSGKQIADELLELSKKIKLYAAVSTLKYLRMGGRLSGAAAVMGTMLNIKPIIELTDGKIYSNYKCIGFKKAKMMLVDLFKKDSFDESYPVYIGHSDNLAEAQEFEQTFKENVKCKFGGIYDIGSVVGTHCGPGAVALIFFRK